MEADERRLLTDRERKLIWLRAKIERPLAEGGDFSDEDIEKVLNDLAQRPMAQGN